jgi:hypothetical protein
MVIAAQLARWNQMIESMQSLEGNCDSHYSTSAHASVRGTRVDRGAGIRYRGGVDSAFPKTNMHSKAGTTD